MALFESEKKDFEGLANALRYKQLALVETERTVGNSTNRVLIICTVEKIEQGMRMTPVVEVIAAESFKTYANPGVGVSSTDMTEGPQYYELPVDLTNHVEAIERRRRIINSMETLQDEEKRILQLANFSDSIAMWARDTGEAADLNLSPGETITALMLAALSIARSYELSHGSDSIVGAVEAAQINTDPIWEDAKKMSSALASWITDSAKRRPS